VTGERVITSWQRLRALKHLVDRTGFARVLEAHNGLSGIVAETARLERNGAVVEYDGLWESSLTDSAAKGLPDASIVGFDSRMRTIDEILSVTTKPIIVDGDTGGEPSQFEYLVKELERRGVSAVIIEDKVYPKRNSLDAAASQELEDPAQFAVKIQCGRQAAISEDFLIIARLESLIAGTGLADALERAEQYIVAGADGIMIHSKKRRPDEVLAFAAAYGPLCDRLGRRPLLVSVPTTYNSITDEELAGHGFNIVIHANHLLRASYKAMTEAARTILESGRSQEVDARCASVSEVFAAVGFDRLTAKDRERSAGQQPPVLIPAAGRDLVFPDRPKSLVTVGGRPVIEYQLETIRKAGLGRVVVIRGHEGSQFGDRYATDNVAFCENPRHAETFDLASLFCAEEHMGQGFVLIYADILFDPDILRRLIGARKDIVLALDSSYQYHKHEVHKRLDLAVSRPRRGVGRRSLRAVPLVEIARLGKNIEVEAADYEFIGMAYFSPRGAEALRRSFHECLGRAGAGTFHEAASFGKASITDLLQELVERGVTVHGLEVHKGWLEVHNREDVAIAERELVPMLSGEGPAAVAG
jgi:phosphoenolpyruvate phosphomutase